MSNLTGLATVTGAVPVANAIPARGGRIEDGDAFITRLRDALDEVERVQADANQQVTDLVSGRSEDLHSTMIAVEQADVAFQFMMQVRNKIVSAYQEISRMQF